MKRRHFSISLAAAVAGLASGSRSAAQDGPAVESKAPKHVCQGRNECKGQGGCAHGCGNNGCHGRNDCKGKGGCASEAAKHACKGKNRCKEMGGCASGNRGCAAKNSCKGKGGCEVPLRIDHTAARRKREGKP
jgi:hypothetical protein